MNAVLKILLIIPLVINALFSISRLFAGIENLQHPRGLADEFKENLILLVTCLIVFGLLGWSSHLLIIREKLLAGTGLIILSYVIWPLAFFVTLVFVNRPWH